MDFLQRTWAEIDLDALRYNFDCLKSLSASPLAAVVKANAYGHGAVAVAKELTDAGAAMCAVSNIEEAIELRRADIKAPILILGYTPTDFASVIAENDIIQTVFSFKYASELANRATENGVTVKCHLKIDSGMSRLGFNCRNDLSGITEMEEAARLKGLNVCGAYTHFAAADRDNGISDGFTDGQFERFLSACNKLKADGITLDTVHCCNSAGLMFDPDKHLDMCRAGIILYGCSPSASKTLPFKPHYVMTLKSTVAFVKYIKKGDCVSYGCTFTADKDMKIATVTVGYADGYPRLLSNKGYVTVNGKKADIIGRVCMDQMMIDITDIDGVETGTEVILWGENPTVDDIAGTCGTISYEILCNVSRRVPRVYIKNGKVVDIVNYIV